jgi:hypothetical protein
MHWWYSGKHSCLISSCPRVDFPANAFFAYPSSQSFHFFQRVTLTLSTRAFVCTWGVRLPDPVLHLCMSIYKNFCPASRRDSLRTRVCAALMRVSLQKLSCCTWTSLSTRACAALMRASLQALSCCTWTCLVPNS